MDNDTAIYSGQALSFLVTGLEPYTRYHYRIRAATAKGSDYGNWSEVFTMEDSKCSYNYTTFSVNDTSISIQFYEVKKYFFGHVSRILLSSSAKGEYTELNIGPLLTMRAGLSNRSKIK